MGCQDIAAPGPELTLYRGAGNTRRFRLLKNNVPFSVATLLGNEGEIFLVVAGNAGSEVAIALRLTSDDPDPAITPATGDGTYFDVVFGTLEGLEAPSYVYAIWYRQADLDPEILTLPAPLNVAESIGPGT